MLPSTRWISFEGWDYNGMKERLETALAGVNKDAHLSHAEELMKGQKHFMSENFIGRAILGLFLRWWPKATV
jgi:hypothetical protein